MEQVVVYDSDCHRYRIPKSLQSEFDKMSNAILSTKEWSDEFYEACEDFTAKFGEFRVDGN